MKILVDRALLERILVGIDREAAPAWLTAELAAAIEAGVKEEEARRATENVRQAEAGEQLKEERAARAEVTEALQRTTGRLLELRGLVGELARAACKLDPHSCGGNWCMLRVRARQLLAEQDVQWRRENETWKELEPADRVQLVALHAKAVTGSDEYATLVAEALQGWLEEQ